MENWEWTNGRSVDELAAYLAHALGHFEKCGPSLRRHHDAWRLWQARCCLSSRRRVWSPCARVFGAEIPHYFRHAYDRGEQSVAPRVEYASGLRGADPRCVVSIVGCTGDWTGGWDCTLPGGVDKFITEDLRSGRMVEVIERGEPALMLAHWTGIYWNGLELGFTIFQEVRAAARGAV